MKPRFVEISGGLIMDRATGRHIASVAVRQLDTTTAQRVSRIIVAALLAEFGPNNPEIEICRAPASN